MPNGKENQTSENAEKKVPVGKRFSKANQPTGKAKSNGKKKAKAKKLLLEALAMRFASKYINFTKNGRKSKMRAFPLAMDNLISASVKDPEIFLKVLKLMSDFEQNALVMEFNRENAKRKYSELEDDDFDTTFIDALNAKTEEVWADEV